MSIPISKCLVVASAEGDEAAYAKLLEALIYNLALPAFSMVGCVCGKNCTTSAEKLGALDARLKADKEVRRAALPQQAPPAVDKIVFPAIKNLIDPKMDDLNEIMRVQPMGDPNFVLPDIDVALENMEKDANSIKNFGDPKFLDRLIIVKPIQEDPAITKMYAKCLCCDAGVIKLKDGYACSADENHEVAVHALEGSDQDPVVVPNAVTCRICGAPAHRMMNRFQCIVNPQHFADLNVVIFTDHSRPNCS